MQPNRLIILATTTLAVLLVGWIMFNFEKPPSKKSAATTSEQNLNNDDYWNFQSSVCDPLQSELNKEVQANWTEATPDIRGLVSADLRRRIQLAEMTNSDGFKCTFVSGTK